MMHLLLNIPHASLHIPEGHPLRKLPQERLGRELLHMTDRYTDELFDHGLCPTAKAKVSRLVCDIERFPKDEEEPMAGRGMGAVYTRGYEGLSLYPSYIGDEPEREKVMETYYWPYHRKLCSITKDILQNFGRALILDCHSFSSSPLPYEPNQTEARPEICLGTDSFHTPSWLLEAAKSFFEDCGFNVVVDSPYSGSLVPLEFYGKDKNVMSLMVEVRRDLYMDEATGKKKASFRKVKEDLRAFELLLLGIEESFPRF